MPSFLEEVQQLLNPRTLLGGGLLAASASGSDYPGYVDEATQLLRNEFTSPAALPGRFRALVDQFQGPFLPLFEQQEKRFLDDLQQRETAGLPSSFTPAMQGSEIRKLRDATTQELLPRRQAFIGDLGLKLLSQQDQAANNLMNFAKPDPLKEALGQLAGALLMSGRNGGGGGGGGGGTTGNAISDLLGKLLGTGGGTGGTGGSGGILGTIQNLLGGGGTSVGTLTNLARLFGGGNSLQQGLGLLTGGSTLSPGAGASLVSQVSQMFGGASVGGFEQLGNGSVQILGEGVGEFLGTISPNGAVTNAAGQQVGNLSGAGSSGGGLLSGLNPFGSGFAPGFGTSVSGGTSAAFSSLGGLLSFVGTGAAAFGAGKLIGGQFKESELVGTAAGAAGGAAAGAALGTFIFPGIGTALGSIIGSLAGGGGGFLGSRGAAQAQKAMARSADLKSENTTVTNIGSFWTEVLGAAGYEKIDEYANFVKRLSAESSDPGKHYSFDGMETFQDQDNAAAFFGGKALLRMIQRENQNITSLDQVPGLRDKYIEFILTNTFIEQGGGVTKTQNIGQKQGLVNMAFSG